MSQPRTIVVFHWYFSVFLGVINFCCNMNEISTFSLLSPFIFQDFQISDFLGVRVSHLLEFLFSGTLWAPIFEPRGSHLIPLPPICSLLGSFWSLLLDPFLDLFGYHLAPFGSVWFPFGFLVAPFGFLGLVLPLATQRLCNDGPIRYIYNTRNKTYIHVCS